MTEALESGQPARSLQLTAVREEPLYLSFTLNLLQDDSSIIAELNLLTLKPCIYAANVSESDLKDQVKNHIPVGTITQLSTFRARKIPMSANYER